jgi:hypothetical protein
MNKASIKAWCVIAILGGAAAWSGCGGRSDIPSGSGGGATSSSDASSTASSGTGGAGGGTSSSSSAVSSSSAASSSSSSSSSSGACSPATPYAGALCGPNGACTVLVDETFAQGTFALPGGSFGSFGAGQTPAIALDASCAPHVLTAVEWSGTIYSSRDPATGWSSETTAMPKYSGSLVFGLTGPMAVVSDGDWNTTLWARTSQWTQVDQIPVQSTIDGPGLGIDASGALHAALWGPAGITLAIRGGSWSTQAGATGPIDPVLSVSTTAASHLAYWGWLGSAPQQGLYLSWWSPPSAPELIAMAGGTSDEQIGIATSAPDAGNPAGKPHVVFGLPSAGGNNQVVYTTRTGPSQWTTVTIVQGTPNQCLATVPTAPGQTCSYDYTADQPIGIAVSQSGDARVFYGSSHFTGTETAVCGSGNPPPCGWSGSGPAMETDTLHVAWVAGGVVQTTALTSTHNPSVATIAIDTTGTMHLAFYEAVAYPGGATTSTRYLRVGLASP